jgi:hypothetical protein
VQLLEEKEILLHKSFKFLKIKILKNELVFINFKNQLFMLIYATNLEENKKEIWF